MAKTAYKYFVVGADSILSGWDYKEDARDDARQIKENFPISRVTILSRAGAKRIGLPVDDTRQWKNYPEVFKYRSESPPPLKPSFKIVEKEFMPGRTHKTFVCDRCLHFFGDERSVEAHEFKCRGSKR